MTTRATSAGLNSVYGSFRDSRGLFAGFANLTTGDTNVGSGSRRMLGARNFPLPNRTPNVQSNLGDDGVIDTYQFQSSEPAQATLELGAVDVEMESAAQNSGTLTLAGLKMGIRGMSNPTFEDMMITAHSQANSKDTAGGKKWLTQFFPNSEMRPVGPESAAHQAIMNNRYNIVFNPFETLPWGQLLESSDFAVEDGLYFYGYGDYPYMLWVKVGNNTWTEVVVDFTPVSVALTHFGIYTVGGSYSAATVSSVTPGTKTIALSAAPATGAFAIGLIAAASLPN
jgi:hypothetical protein